MHHAVIDGVSGVGLSEIMLDASPSRARRPNRRTTAEVELPGIERRALGALFNLTVMTPYRAARVVAQNGDPAAGRAVGDQQAAELLRGPGDPVQHHADTAAPAGHRPVVLDRVKAVKNASR